MTACSLKMHKGHFIDTVSFSMLLNVRISDTTDSVVLTKQTVTVWELQAESKTNTQLQARRPPGATDKSRWGSTAGSRRRLVLSRAGP